MLQTQARLWWDTKRDVFDLYTSQTVLDEAALGNASAAADRLRLLQVYAMLEELGASRPLICTPAEFLENPEDDEQSDT